MNCDLPPRILLLGRLQSAMYSFPLHHNFLLSLHLFAISLTEGSIVFHFCRIWVPYCSPASSVFLVDINREIFDFDCIFPQEPPTFQKRALFHAQAKVSKQAMFDASSCMDFTAKLTQDPPQVPPSTSSRYTKPKISSA